TLIGEGVDERPEDVQILYVSPLKALNNDMQQNVARPLAGVARTAERLGCPIGAIRSAVRTGDTPSSARQAMLRRPPHILITTPESLYLLLTGQKSAQILRSVRYVIVDEIHALAPSKRGVHLALSLERLTEIAGEFVRIGLSATQRPLAEIARFLGGSRNGVERPVAIVDAGMRKSIDLEVVCPAPFSNPEGSVWPAVESRLLEWISAHRSTLIFVNGRGTAERLSARLNELAQERGLIEAGALLVHTHHGSLAREQRERTEALLKSGQLAGIVATSSLELGIDIGAIDLVVQIESPKSVARGLQRVGRAGHVLAATSVGRIVPQYDGDLVEAAVIARRMLKGEIETTIVPQNCLDVLAQQLVAIVAGGERSVDELLALVRQAYPYGRLERAELIATLRMLAKPYALSPTTPGEPARSRPRLFFDAAAQTARPHPGSRYVAIHSGGTIPDRGLYAVVVSEPAGAGSEGPGGRPAGGGETPAATNRRFHLGELDEEFVFESREGDVFRLGNGVWRIDAIGRDRVVVSPASGQLARRPFWKGEGLGRPYELGLAVGEFLESMEQALAGGGAAAERLLSECRLDAGAAHNLLDYLGRQREATGSLPSHRRLVLERFADPLGDVFTILHSPFGGRVNAAWALALQDRFRRALGLEVKVLHADGGLAVKWPQAPALAADPGEAMRAALTELSTSDVAAAVRRELGGSPLFALCFRHAARRALLMPTQSRRRMPLWLQRLKGADLLEAARREPDHPLIREALREALTEVLDVAGLQRVLAGLAAGEIRLQALRRQSPSPFAVGFMEAFTGAFMYAEDEPRPPRPQAPDPSAASERLAALLGHPQAGELLAPGAVDELTAELQRTKPDWRARSADELDDLMAELGELTSAEIAERLSDPAQAAAWTADLAARGRIRRHQVAQGGPEFWLHVDCAPDPPSAAARYTQTRGPFTTTELAARFGLPEAQAGALLAQLAAAGELEAGPFGPDGGAAWCHPHILLELRRRTLRRATAPEPLAADELDLFWRRLHLGAEWWSPEEALAETLAALSGLALPVAVWERDIFSARLRDYRGERLDALLARGDFLWVAAGARGDRVAFFARAELPELPERPEPGVLSEPAARPEPAATDDGDEGLAESGAAQAVRQALAARGALFLSDLAAVTGLSRSHAVAALWELAAAGAVTTDRFEPLRRVAAGFRPPSPGESPVAESPEAVPCAAPSRSADPLRFGRPGGYRRRDRALAERVRAQVDAEAIFSGGRWQLTPPGARALLRPAGDDASPEVMRWWLDTLLRRYGLIARELVQWEGQGTLWPALRRACEAEVWRGALVRAYFTRALSGPQFVTPEAFELARRPAEQATAARDGRAAI
ncbi:MAG TPA: DEAD/DEAH box helicase, partial [Limnochordia bacterium]|nr:DEAD/DEAH box helicase [Limnochordia bacterium]